MAVTVEYGSRRLVVEPVEVDDPEGVCYLGRGGPGEYAVWIRLTTTDGTLPRRAVAISCPMEGVWAIRRLSERAGVEVRFDDGSRLVVPSDRWRMMPADDDHAYVVVTSPTRTYEFSVRRGRHGDPYTGPDGGDGVATRVLVRSDPDLGYFRVCVALCESKLLDPFQDEVPTEDAILQRILRSGVEPSLTLKRAQRRLESVREKIDVSSNRELRDRLIASRAVTVEHLGWLRPRP